ncbi:MAG: 50S ribosomal protein L35 [Candidatus Berkelbacteria bacterium]|nr:50S ribosomal protein L35 [Candidatus Berkelbacteria bacterium]
MPKLKTRKTASKRLVKITVTGKLLRRKTTAQHLVHRKSKRTIERSGSLVEIKKSDLEKMKKLTPYRKK